MALPKPSGLSAPLLLLVLVVAEMAEPGVAFKLDADNTSSHLPPLLDCGPASPAPSAAFRANVVSLLGALPSAAAAATTGFAATRSHGRGPDRAFARGLCFGTSGGGGDCLACLSAAASDVAARCSGSRRGGTWPAGCFVSFADTNATSARERRFRDWFYDDDDGDGSSPTAALTSRCAGDRAAAAECARCLNESALVVPELKRRRQLSPIHGDSVVVVGYDCVLRVLLVPPSPLWETILFYIVFVIDVVGVAVVDRPVAFAFNWRATISISHGALTDRHGGVAGARQIEGCPGATAAPSRPRRTDLFRPPSRGTLPRPPPPARGGPRACQGLRRRLRILR